MVDDMRPGYWRTKDGRTLVVREMETDHLRRCVAMLDRQASVIDCDVAFFDTVKGEIARESAGDAVGAAMLMAYALRAKQRELESELAARTGTV